MIAPVKTSVNHLRAVASMRITRIYYCQYAFHQLEAVRSLNGLIELQAFSFLFSFVTAASDRVASFVYHKSFSDAINFVCVFILLSPGHRNFSN